MLESSKKQEGFCEGREIDSLGAAGVPAPKVDMECQTDKVIVMKEEEYN